MTKPTLLPDPIPFVGGYALDLYCRYDHPYPGVPINVKSQHTFSGRSFAEAKRAAVARGWTFHTAGLTTCPYCNDVIRGKI